MPTDAQIAANRLNAEKSCGPKSPESKQKVSQNRTTHGLCGAFRVLSCERQEQFDALVTGLMEAEQPADDSERELVVKMAQHSWRAARALRMEDACFEVEDEVNRTFTVNSLSLETAMRYHTRHDRAYQRAAKELMERRKQRQLAEIGFERQKAGEAQAKRQEEAARHKEAEARRKAEKHELVQEVTNLKKQLLEIRLAKHLIAAMNKNVGSTAAREQEFELNQLSLAA